MTGKKWPPRQPSLMQAGVSAACIKPVATNAPAGMAVQRAMSKVDCVSPANMV